MWQISTTGHFDRMRTALLCLIVEVTNDSIFSKRTKIVDLISLCIWFTFYSMLSFFSSEGHFCMSYLLMLSGVTTGKLREGFTEWRENFAAFTLETAEQSHLPVSSFITHCFESFSSKDKEKSILSFHFQQYRVLLYMWFHSIYRIFQWNYSQAVFHYL